jgi:VCBS repeat-containing protein
MRTITGLRVSAAAAGAVAALAFIPSGANAAFDSAHDTQCESAATIAGIGASFQRQAHLAWGAQMLAPDPAAAEENGFGYATTANGGCATFRVGATNGKTVTYEPRGSGDGRNAMGASTVLANPNATPPVSRVAGIRNTRFQFAGADEPPNPGQLAAANAGPTDATTDDAVLLTLPVAQSSVATVVQLPAGCTVPAADRKITRARLEGAFAGNAGFTQWGQILPGISGTDCAAKPVKRIVRLDSSGTTFAFKNYLRDVSAADFPASLGNQTWPNDSGATAVVKPTSNGAGPLLDLLKSRTEEGGIGYADLAASRARGFDSALQPATLPGTTPGSTIPNPNAGQPDPTDTSFWVTVEGRDGQFRSPALSDAAGTTNTGSNCREAAYSDPATGKLPAVTESWTNVNANGSTAAYPLCALTYALVWQDMIKANVGIPAGQPAYTQDQARSVKDYLGYILNANGGQAALAPNGYQGLPSVDPSTSAAVPSSVLDVAEAGRKTLTWNGQPVVVTPPPTGDGGGTTTTTPVTTTPVVTTPVVVPTTTTPTTPATVPTTPTKPATTPAAKLTISKAAGLKGRKISLTVSPSAAGKVAVTATTVRNKKTVTLGKGTVSVKKGGKLVLTITPSKAGKRALTAGRTVTVKFKVTFTASTGKKVTVTKSIKVKVKR